MSLLKKALVADQGVVSRNWKRWKNGCQRRGVVYQTFWVNILLIVWLEKEKTAVRVDTDLIGTGEDGDRMLTDWIG